MSAVCSIAVIMACHNRKDKTSKCLNALYLSGVYAGVRLVVYLFDDGSTDGTAGAAREVFSDIVIIKGDGDNYWNKSMSQAMALALSDGGFDYYLWLNDDTYLDDFALKSIINDSRKSGVDCVIVGAVTNTERDRMTYGGLKKVGALAPFAFSFVSPGTRLSLDTFTGNCVLISSRVACQIGTLDSAFEHSMGDVDYGLMVTKAGYKIFSSTRYVGVCDLNSLVGGYKDPNLPLLAGLRHLFSRKGLPVRSWFHLNRKHGGVFWIFWFVAPYVRQIFGITYRRSRDLLCNLRR